MQIAAYVNTSAIKASYAPFHTMPAFEQGYNDYLANVWGTRDGVAGMAYDRGQEAAMKALQASRWVSENVGAN